MSRRAVKTLDSTGADAKLFKTLLEGNAMLLALKTLVLLLLAAVSHTHAEPNEWCSNCTVTGGTNRAESSALFVPGYQLMSLAGLLDLQPPSRDEALKLGTEGLAGFFFSAEQTISVVESASALDKAITPRGFPDPLLESLKALARVILSGPTKGAKLNSQLSDLGNGNTARTAITWNPDSIITAEIAFANALHRYNQVVDKAATSNPGLFKDRNFLAINKMLTTMNSGYRAGKK